MRSLNATQLALLAATDKEISWLFTVVTLGASTYTWSTKAKTFSAVAYTAKVRPESFSGITLNRAKNEYGIQAPNDLSFQALNTGSALTDSDFVGATVTVNLVMENATYAATSIMQWKFRATYCKDIYQILNFTCEDFAQQYLKGYYPLGKKTRALSDSRSITPKDKACVPVIFGTAYIPIRPVYLDADSKFYYVLGPAGPTYAVSAVYTPKEWKTQKEWTSPTYTFNQYDKTLKGTSYRVLGPIIADSDANGVVDACGLWKDGDYFLDMPCKFARSDTTGLTSPEEIIEYLLEDFGVPSADIDTGVGSSFATAATTFASWNLTMNFGLWKKEPKKVILARVLSACHSVLDITDKIELRVLSKTSKATIDQSYVVRHGDAVEGTFRASPITTSGHDSGYILFQEDGKPQDRHQEILVSALSAGTTAAISDEQLDLTMIQDTQVAQAIGTLHFQRLLRANGQVSFESPGKSADLQPDDVITSGHANYGGTYTALIDQLSIDRDGGVRVTASTFSEAFLDFGDLAPSAIVWVDDGKPFWMWEVPYVTVSPVRGEAMFETIAAAIAGLPSWAMRIVLLRGAFLPAAALEMPTTKGIDIVGTSRDESIIYAPDGDNLFEIIDSDRQYRFGNFRVVSQNTVSGTYMFKVLGSTGASDNNSDVIIDSVNSTLVDEDDYFVYADSGEDGGLTIMNCVCKNASYVGRFCRVVRYENVTVRDNKVRNIYVGMYFGSVDDLHVLDNIVRQFALFGIYAAGTEGAGSKFHAMGNTVRTSQAAAYYGMYFNNWSEFQIMQNIVNMVVDGATNVWAMTIDDCTDGNLSNNKVAVDNQDATAWNYGYVINDVSLRNVIQGNHADMVNSRLGAAGSARDVGYFLHANSGGANRGGDNIAYRCGDDLDDNGSNAVLVNGA